MVCLVEQHDGLNRLTGTQRGTLDSGSLTNETNEQTWTLSATGAWVNYTEDADGDGTDDTDEDRTYNDANELTDISTTGAIDPTHDAAGNMTLFGAPDDNTSGIIAVYDAWGVWSKSMTMRITMVSLTRVKRLQRMSMMDRKEELKKQ